MGSRIDELFRFHQTALNLRAVRQEVLAANIANADTPNYKARDLDFASALRGALQAQHAATPHPGGAERVQGAPLLYRVPLQPSADGNTVDLDVERAQFADNALRYEASLRFVSEKAKEVLAALQG